MQRAAVQPLHQLLRRAETDAQLDLRILAVIPADVVHRAGHGGVEHPDLQNTGLAGAEIAHTVGELAHSLEQLAALRVELLPGLGDHDALVFPHEQLHLQLVLQKRELARNGRLRDVQLPCGGGDGALLRDGAEVFQLVDRHRKPSCICIYL